MKSISVGIRGTVARTASSGRHDHAEPSGCSSSSPATMASRAATPVRRRPSPTAVPPSAAGPVVTAEDAVARVDHRGASLRRHRRSRPDPDRPVQLVRGDARLGCRRLLVTMRIGWGDCEAGCIDEHTCTYAVGPTGSVTLQSDAGSPIPRMRLAVAGEWRAPPRTPVSTSPPSPARRAPSRRCHPIRHVPRIRSRTRRYSIADANGHQQDMVMTDADRTDIRGTRTWDLHRHRTRCGGVHERTRAAAGDGRGRRT